MVNDLPSDAIIAVRTADANEQRERSAAQVSRSTVNFKKCVEQLMQGSKQRISRSQSRAVCSLLEFMMRGSQSRRSVSICRWFCDVGGTIFANATRLSASTW
jgi:hypothetical protein